MSILGQDGSYGELRNVPIRINRPAYTCDAFNDKFERQSEPSFSVVRSVRRFFASNCTPRCLRSAVLGFFPFISVMKSYSWKKNLFKDVIAGATVSAMHIPQGMAYGQLATLRPVHGLYVSFFPVLLYFFFGTSQHISIGSFAVISLMVAKVLDAEVANGFFASLESSSIYNVTNGSVANQSSFSNSTIEDQELAIRVELAVSLNFITGILQILLGFLGAGFITAYLSEPFISGYTTGCACQVFTSQLKYIFGIRTKRHTGAFKIYHTWRDVILNITETNLVTFGLSACAAVFLLICKLVIDPRIKRFSPMPIPAELLLMVMAVIVSYFANLGPGHQVRVVGHIPQNLPVPRLPTYFHPQLVIDSIPLVLVSFSLCISMGKLFAKKYKYKIRSNQEFFAVGISNAVSSFFECYTSSASMSRSLVQANVGGQTQLAGLVSCIVIFSVIMFLGSLLQPLPVCILAIVVMVNLRGMFLQAWDLEKYWRHCKLDVATWCVAFLATVVVDVDIGLYVGVGFVLATVVFQSGKVQSVIMKQAGNTELFAHAKNFGNLTSTKPAIVIRWPSPIYFATVDKFLSAVNSAVNISPKTSDVDQSDKANGTAQNEENRGGELEPVKPVIFGADEEPIDLNSEGNNEHIVSHSLPLSTELENSNALSRRTHLHPSQSEDLVIMSPAYMYAKDIKAVILDLCGVTFIDTVGLDALKQLAEELPHNGFNLLLSSSSDCVLDMLSTEESLEEFNKLNVFVSPVDALVAVRRGDIFARFNVKGDMEKPAVSTRSPPRQANLADSHTCLIQAQLAGLPNRPPGEISSPVVLRKDDESTDNLHN